MRGGDKILPSRKHPLHLIYQCPNVVGLNKMVGCSEAEELGEAGHPVVDDSQVNGWRGG